MLKVTTYGPDDAEALGRKIAQLAFPGMFIALMGDLGAGKTELAKGIAQGLGAKDAKSPSYTIMNIYEARLPIYHFDAYRLAEDEDMSSIGGDEYFYGKGVCIVEWADRIQSELPQNRLDISICYGGLNKRELLITGYGTHKSIEEALHVNTGN